MKAHSVTSPLKASYDDIFHDRMFVQTTHAFWRLGSTTFVPFLPRARKRTRRINPVFKSKYLITPKKWIKLGQYVRSDPHLTEEIQELVRIRTHVAWRQKRVPPQNFIRS